ncbi:ECF RNA polymerase sigma factor SigK [Haloechinothrix sp. LS1_15]|uniref:ECF RNA polymerase sigma factor SigK n=1 Tax=Haloechinothrix sp. LS1_15 TaxID=2652248 RepID=UPI002943FBD5|nr:ECF RNA polymerase sigma factor SigK [Haloechinothrix sp. LS1_15]MDV6011387.1 sigma-70 family RNA polymerase sigma factor [Haloechinothrix sp. LS1_15]
MHGGAQQRGQRRWRAANDDVTLTPEELLARVALGDEYAFARLYDAFVDRIFGLVKRVMRDPAQAEEVTQEVFLEIWRTATRFDSSRGSVVAWAMMLAHRRAVDRVRSAQASTERDSRVASQQVTPFDSVSEEVTGRLEREQIRRCLETLTALQQESVTLAYYQGYTYSEVASLLGSPLGTVKTRLRDGLIRLRDCLGVTV